MLDRERAALVVIDFQGRLAESMPDYGGLLASLRRLVQGARLLGLPILCTEQLPDKLGATRPELAGVLDGVAPIPKSTFSCCGAPGFEEALERMDRGQVLLAGIETHVCVYQTAADLLDAGYEVHVPADAVASRTEGNKTVALSRMRAEGARISSVEMALFELQRAAGGETFRSLLALIK